jgi:hypothetical protein
MQRKLEGRKEGRKERLQGDGDDDHHHDDNEEDDIRGQCVGGESTFCFATGPVLFESAREGGRARRGNARELEQRNKTF